MALTKRRIGNLIRVVDERNLEGLRRFYGVNIDKELMPTVANTTGLDETKYKVVRKHRFVYSGMQTGRDKCIRITMHSGDEPVIVSPAYTTFEIADPDEVMPEYFFMLFLSKEKDRLGWFYSDSSIRANLDWDVFCDIELDLPPIEGQRKYAGIFNSLIANRDCYLAGLDDMRLTCDAFIEKLVHDSEREPIAPYIHEYDKRNSASLGLDAVRGISIEKKFIPTKANMDGVNLSNYKIVEPGDIAFVTVTSRNGEKITIAMNDSEEDYIVSATYVVFTADDIHLSPDYLMLYFSRAEFDRYARFNSWGSARETFNWTDMLDLRIPLPPIEVQRSIANVYLAYVERRRIAEELKRMTHEICPVLIKGAIEEASRF